jgi:hypothetical protein
MPILGKDKTKAHFQNPLVGTKELEGGFFHLHNLDLNQEFYRSSPSAGINTAVNATDRVNSPSLVWSHMRRTKVDALTQRRQLPTHQTAGAGKQFSSYKKVADFSSAQNLWAGFLAAIYDDRTDFNRLIFEPHVTTSPL